MTSQRRAAIIRDVLALYRRYDEREIRDAIEAIERGEALRDTLKLAILGQHIYAAASGTRAERQRTPQRSSHARARDNFREMLSRLNESEEKDQRRIAEFLTGIETHQVLQTGALLRDFARGLGITVSDSKVERLAVAKRIGEELLKQPPHEQTRFLEMGRQLGGGKSSLQEWSDIIVKG